MLCHSINLTIKDVFDFKFKIVKETVIQLIDYFIDISIHIKTLPEVPHFKETRWFSLFYCVSYIISNKEYLDNYHQELYDSIQNNFDCNYIKINLESNFYQKVGN